MKKLCLLLLALGAVTNLMGQDTTFTVRNQTTALALFANASSNALPIGSVVKLGNFGTNLTLATNLLAGGVTDTELPTINSYFDTAITFAIGNGTSTAGRFNVTGTNIFGNFFGEEAWLLVYNVSSGIDAATQFGAFRRIEGFFPTAGNPELWTPNNVSTLTGQAYAGSIVGSTSPNGEFWLLGAVTAIPEPGTVAAMIAGLIALPFVRRMRKQG